MKKKEKQALDNYIAGEYQKFTKIYPKNQDPILSILRVHLLTEYYLESILCLLTPRGDKISKSNLSYFQKLNVLESFDQLDNRIIQSLKNLNKVRNGCAHEFDKTISESDIELFGRPLGKEHTKIKHDCVGDFKEYLFQILYRLCGHLVAEVWGLEIENILENEKGENGTSS